MKRLLITSLALVALTLAITRERSGRVNGGSIAVADLNEVTDEATNQVDDADDDQSPGPTAARGVASVESAAPFVMISASTARRIEEYRTLERKVFPSADEASARGALIRDEALLTDLGRLVLARAKPNAAEMRDQDAALALLLEARANGSPAATEVLTAVVKDAAVEDQTLDRGVREHLAGLKAEVLYEWSATEPARAAQLAESLPGPVSRQLWENVRMRQRSNLAESAAEIADDVH